MDEDGEGVKLEGHRPVYKQRDRKDFDNPQGKISYCEQIKCWVFTINDVSKGLEANDCRWLAKSRVTDALSLEDVEESDWTIFTGIVEETLLDITCADCNNEMQSKDGTDVGCNFRGLCNSNGTCDCLNDWTGHNCDVCAACTEFELLVKKEGINDSALMSLNSTVFARLNDYRSPIAGGIQVYRVYDHPVYYHESYTTNSSYAGDVDVIIIYSGSQYWIMNTTNICPLLVECLDIFHSTFDHNELNEPLYVSEITTGPIHSELKWFRYNPTRYKGLEDALPFEIKCRDQLQREKCEFLF